LVRPFWQSLQRGNETVVHCALNSVAFAVRLLRRPLVTPVWETLFVHPEDLRGLAL